MANLRFVHGLLFLAAAFAIAPAGGQVQPSNPQVAAVLEHGHNFLGNFQLQSTPMERLRLDGGGTVEFWVDPRWNPADQRQKGDAYVLACRAGTRLLYSVFFRETDQGLKLGFTVGDSNTYLIPLGLEVEDTGWYHIALISNDDPAERGTILHVGGLRFEIADQQLSYRSGTLGQPLPNVVYANPLQALPGSHRCCTSAPGAPRTSMATWAT